MIMKLFKCRLTNIFETLDYSHCSNLMHLMLSGRVVCSAATVPLGLQAIFILPNTLEAVKVAALNDFSKEARHGSRSYLI